jgi:hypothetical protein
MRRFRLPLSPASEAPGRVQAAGGFVCVLVRSVECVVEVRSEGRHQVPVGLQCGLDAGMAEAGLDLFGMRALLDHEGRGRVAEIVEPRIEVEASLP